MRCWSAFGAIFAIFLTTTSVQASVVDMLGDQDFADGALGIAVLTDGDTGEAYFGDRTGDPDPFNRFFGQDAQWESNTDGDGAWGWVQYYSAGSGWYNVWEEIPTVSDSGTGWVDYGTYIAWTGGGTSPSGATHLMLPTDTYDLRGEFGQIDYSHALAQYDDLHGATLEIGLFDHDDFYLTGDLVLIEVFDEDAADWITLSGWDWAGPSVGPSSYHILSMLVDPDLLMTNGGVLDVRITAIGSGRCEVAMGDYTPQCYGNGIGVDFSRLTVEMPIPASGILLLAGFAGLAMVRRRKG